MIHYCFRQQSVNCENPILLAGSDFLFAKSKHFPVDKRGYCREKDTKLVQEQ